jgi:hypothetical protein
MFYCFAPRGFAQPLTHIEFQLLRKLANFYFSATFEDVRLPIARRLLRQSKDTVFSFDLSIFFSSGAFEVVAVRIYVNTLLVFCCKSFGLYVFQDIFFSDVLLQPNSSLSSSPSSKFKISSLSIGLKSAFFCLPSLITILYFYLFNSIMLLC